MKKGDRVKIKNFAVRPGFWNYEGHMDEWMGKTVTVLQVIYGRVRIVEDHQRWCWQKEDFEEIPLLPEELFEI